MKNFQIYLAGGMSKFDKDKFDEGNNWRVVLKNVFENNEKMNVTVINPNDYFNFKDNPPQYRSQREVMEFDLNKVRNSDLIIINYNDMYSLGTMAELAIAYEHRIPVIGLDEQKQELYPWQVEMTNRIFDNIQELIEYVKCFYLCE
ncbi:MAG: nucleoside 2-deoxyribosyltransferase [Paludibacteraceae bacterium]|nr:nucleoside 2-deoxyribosyltransferase [Paludibacteraceae bacterium]